MDLSKEGAEWVRQIVQIAEKRKPVTSLREGASVDGVLIDKVETENGLELGPQIVALKAWEELKLSEILTAAGLSVSVSQMAKLMILNRLIDPLSEWALIDWSQRTALPEMLDVRVTKTSKDRLYRTSDTLLKSRKAIEKSLRKQEMDLFTLRRSIVLYDVTNTHFEGDCKANPKAKRGKNKQKRNDCPQVALGVAYDEHGFALAHEVFEGNMADTNTLGLMLERLDLDDKDLLPVVILDAGFASEENIARLEEKGYSYLVNITRGSRKEYAQYFNQEAFTALPNRPNQQQVEVKTIVDPKNKNRRLVLCRSQQRRLKEVSMLSTAEKRFVEGAEALRKRIEKGQLKDPLVIERKIGALKQKNTSVHRYYTLKHENKTLEITRLDEKIEEALSLCGDYVLKTSQNLDAQDLWYLYMTLLKAEKGFKMLKGTLGMRPNFHQLENRVDGHIFISILAYHLLTWIQYKLENAGDKREWKTIRRLLRTHHVNTTRLQLKDGRTVLIRKPATPDAEQARVYQLLGIDWKNSYSRKITEIEA